ncbi:MAG TPA: ATP-binding cassette domain-containing protein [Hyphomicrobiaceae bacterium]|nr:ATP-binding cassette domain-containing protein [Hyphomicrobiaceae bacterium]
MSGVRFAWPGRNPFSMTIDAFALPAGRRVLLIGPSGSGKSTFLGLICGIVAPQAGAIEVLGTDITRLPASARDGFRAEHCGIIFQMFNLLPYGTVLDNALLPLSFAPARRRRATAAGRAEDEAVRLLTRLGLDPHLTRGPSAANLSVGQQQRVAAARALIGSPELIVADEPTSALDRNRQAAFLDLLFAEVAQAAATLIMVSHDETLVPRFDEVMRLDDIAVCRQGRPSPAAGAGS